MPKKSPELKSWQIFHFARKHLGRTTLYSIFGKRHARTVDLWCEDPRYTARDEKSFDPISGIAQLIEEMDDAGHLAPCRSVVNLMIAAAPSAYPGVIEDGVVDLKSTVHQEILADYQAVARLQDAIERGVNPVDVYDLKDAAIHEIERTYAKYLQESRK